MVKLNYEASLGEFLERAPFSVKTTGDRPPGDRFRDFIPQTAPVTKDKLDTKVARKDFMRAPIHRYEQDFISGEDAKALTHNDNVRIRALAKELYIKSSKKRVDYKAAKKLVDNASRRELEHPSEELERAMRIVARKPPIDKKSALEEAAKQFYGHTR